MLKSKGKIQKGMIGGGLFLTAAFLFSLGGYWIASSQKVDDTIVIFLGGIAAVVAGIYAWWRT